MSDRTLVLFVGALAAVALLLGVKNLGSGAVAPIVAEQSADAASGVIAPPLEERVAALEAELIVLRDALEARPRPHRGRAGDDADGDRERARRVGRASVDAATGKESLIEALDEGDPEVEERIGALVRDQLETEREERWDRRQERMEERSRERLTTLADDVGLDAAQVDVLHAALTAERDQIVPLFRAAREDGNWREAREKATVVRAATDEQVAESLDAEQLQGWQEMRDEEQTQRRGR